MTTLSTATLSTLSARIDTPSYDRLGLTAGVMHIGVGGFHRAHEAVYLDDLLRTGNEPSWALTGVGVLPGDRVMADALNTQDGLYTLMVKNDDGSVDARIVGSITGMVHAADADDAVLERMADPAVRIVSLTITEGGYPVDVDSLAFDPTHPSAREDLDGPWDRPVTAVGIIVRALALRHERGLPGFTVLSCDNIRHNGDVAQAAVVGFGRRRAPEVAGWIEETVAFPNSMVDRITPVTTDEDRQRLAREFGVDDRWPVVCERYLQWVIEDRFPTGRPALEDVGVQFTDDVEPYELMKLRMLNAGHQVIGHLGRLAGLTYAHEALEDASIREFLIRFMTDEAAPSCREAPGQDPLQYRDSLLRRFANPYVRDTLARLCADASDRIPTFLLGTLRDNLAGGRPIECCAVVLAAWAVGVRGVNERGESFDPVDPLADSLREASLREATDPGAFLDHPIFGGLGAHPSLRSAYLHALTSLQARGVIATISSPCALSAH